MLSTKILIIFAIFSISLFSLNQVYAADPALVSAIKADPFYWSEDGFGIDVLNSYEQPLDVYLTEQTSQNSSKEEILNAFLQANSDRVTNFIVPENERPQVFIVSFSGGFIKEKKTFFTFSKCEHQSPSIEDSNHRYAPQPKFILESLPSKDKELFYKGVEQYIQHNPLIKPFDVDVQVVTGEGMVLQTWEYENCEITGYFLSKLESKIIFGFTRTFNPEIREETTFECQGFSFNPNQVELTHSNEENQPVIPKNYLPSEEDRGQFFFVRFGNTRVSDLDTITTFSKFNPITVLSKTYYVPYHYNVSVPVTLSDLPIEEPGLGEPCETPGQGPPEGNPGQGSPEGNPGQGSPGGNPGNGSPCDVPGLEPKPIPPQDPNEVISYVVVSGGVSVPITVTRSTEGYSPGDRPQFVLGSLPSKDKEPFYKLVNKWILDVNNPRFNVGVDLITSDGTILQTWEYKGCEINEFQTFLNDSLLSHKFTGAS